MHTLAHDAVSPLLSVTGLSAGYGTLRVLEGLDFAIRDREIVALVGPNGAGKSTLLRALSGLIPKTAGNVLLGGRDISKFSPKERGRAGLVHVIEGHRVFPSLTVDENLLLAGLDLPAAERRVRAEEAYAAFPDIAAKRLRKAGTLSGGQQQMLVVGQAVVRKPRLLMLDEPSVGLAPVLIDRVLQVVTMLRAKGTAVLLVEQAVEKALRVADRVCVLVHGRIVLKTSAAEAQKPGVLEHAYLGSA